jgi:hypothetical protein
MAISEKHIFNKTANLIGMCYLYHSAKNSSEFLKDIEEFFNAYWEKEIMTDPTEENIITVLLEGIMFHQLFSERKYDEARKYFQEKSDDSIRYNPLELVGKY